MELYDQTTDGREILRFIVPAEACGERLDKWLTAMTDMTRSHIQLLLKEELVTVNDLVKPARTVLKGGEEVLLILPEPEPLELLAEDIPLAIVYEDDALLVINKQRNLVVHPAVGNWTGTLVNGLMAHSKVWPGINGTMRPGIVHRLDKDTSGLLVVAKTELAQNSLSQQIKDRTAKRMYLALTWANFKEESGIINAPIGRHPINRLKMAVVANGRQAQTAYSVLQHFPQMDLLKVQLLTGRTHQIRVHMAYAHHPVVADPLYSAREQHWGLEAQALHAYRLGFFHPCSNEWLEFTAPPPQDFRDVLTKLGRPWTEGGEADGKLDFIIGRDTNPANH
ncbi:MAG: RluA family pseudouridine synthase [Negativicutes bacterium]|nr:RluA family pseudouridine synthase [Negativicutes bacterium]